LRDRRLLLIIDNCEHLIAEAAAVIESLLRSVEDARILATSRERLRVPGETTYRVPALSFPKTEVDVSPEQIAQFDAVQLFTQRVRAVRDEFELSGTTALAVANICRRLDGIPFAIELAASRTSSFGLADIAELLERRLNLLSAGPRTALPRHRTMHSLIDWSVELLSTEERLFFERVACFPGYWTADAAAVVCRFGRLESADILGLISSLVDKSLIVAEVTADRARFRLLESTRQFVLENASLQSDRVLVDERIAHWVAEFSDRSAESVSVTPRSRWIPLMRNELDNARFALVWALDRPLEIWLAARIIAGYRSFWMEEGLLSEGFHWTSRAFERLEATDDIALEASLWHSLSTLTDGRRCVEAASEAIARFEQLQDIDGLARSHLRLAAGYRQMAKFNEAESSSERALSLFRRAGGTHSIMYASALSWKASALVGLGRLPEAREAFTEGISLDEALGDFERAAVERLNLAELEFADGNVGEALAHIDSTLQVLRGRHAVAEVVALLNSAAYRIVQGELRAAEAAAERALRLSRRQGRRLWETIAIQHVATIAALEGDPAHAAQLAGYVDACYAEEGVAREPTEVRMLNLLNAALSDQLTVDERSALDRSGRNLTNDEAFDLALSRVPQGPESSIFGR